MRSNTARWRPGNSRDNVFLTPPGILDVVRQAFGGRIGLDPCTEPDNPTGAERFYALPTNGLAEPWDASTIWCNPPYGEARVPWVVRCIEVGQAHRAALALLVPSHTDTRIGQAILAGAEAIVFLRGRVDFGMLRPNGRAWRATHPSMIALWGVDPDPFRRLGIVFIPPETSSP